MAISDIGKKREKARSRDQHVPLPQALEDQNISSKGVPSGGVHAPRKFSRCGTTASMIARSRRWTACLTVKLAILVPLHAALGA